MLVKNRLNFYIKKNRQIVCNNSEEWAEFLCQKADCLQKTNTQIVWNDNEEWTEVLCKKNTQIVCNDRSNEEWAEILCKKEHADCLE